MDPDHFSQLVEQYYEPLYKFALSLTRAEADACDLTQQTFYVWAAKGHQLRDPTKAKSWLFTTLHRAFVEIQRRKSRFPHCELQEVAHELPGVLPDFSEPMDSVQVLAALAELDETYRAAVALFYLEDCSYRDIAVILRVPVGTIRSRLARGLAQLRQRLSSESGDAVEARQFVSLAAPFQALPGVAEPAEVALKE